MYTRKYTRWLTFNIKIGYNHNTKNGEIIWTKNIFHLMK